MSYFDHSTAWRSVRASPIRIDDEFETMTIDIDLDALKACCNAPFEAFESLEGATLYTTRYTASTKTDPKAEPKVMTDRYIYIDNGAPILAVAHLDTVQHLRHFAVAELTGETRIFTAQADDRLGAYLITHYLPSVLPKGANGKPPYDILLTDGEERGASSAYWFQPVSESETGTPRYRWMFEIDRRGTDVVGYDYEKDPQWDIAITEAGWRSGYGSYTDICELKHLGILGFNFGAGYQDNHAADGYIILEDLIVNVRRVIRFFHRWKDTYMPYRPLERPASSASSVASKANGASNKSSNGNGNGGGGIYHQNRWMSWSEFDQAQARAFRRPASLLNEVDDEGNAVEKANAVKKATVDGIAAAEEAGDSWPYECVWCAEAKTAQENMLCAQCSALYFDKWMGTEEFTTEKGGPDELLFRLPFSDDLGVFPYINEDDLQWGRIPVFMHLCDHCQEDYLSDDEQSRLCPDCREFLKQLMIGTIDPLDNEADDQEHHQAFVSSGVTPLETNYCINCDELDEVDRDGLCEACALGHKGPYHPFKPRRDTH